MRIDSAEFVLSAQGRTQFPRDGLPEVAFVGRSNVGKSSLMNRLLRRKKLARTSSHPGRTRAVNYFLINRRFYFVDLPGYGYAKVGKDERRRWAVLMEQYLQHVASSGLVVQLVDTKVGATDLDLQAHDYFVDQGLELMVVATKIDKVTRGKRWQAEAKIRGRLALPEGQEALMVSAVSGEGIQQLWNGITAFLSQVGKNHHRTEAT